MTGFMHFKEVNSFPTNVLFRLGLWYGIYRIVVVVILLIIYSTQNPNNVLISLHTSPLFVSLFVYFFWVLLQFFYYAVIDDSNRNNALFSFALIDVVFFGVVFISLPHNYYINSIFIIMLFVVNLIIPPPRVFILISLGVISCTIPMWLNLLGFTNIHIGVGRIGFSIASVVISSILGRIIVGYLIQLQQKTVNQNLHLINLDKVTKTIVNELTIGCLVFNNDYHLIYSNQASYDLLNIKLNEYNTFAKTHQVLITRLQTTSIDEFEYEYNHSTILVKKKRLALEGTQGFWTVAFIEDKANIVAQIQKVKLQELGKLSASIAHEIRNPLATIVQANDLLLHSDNNQQAKMIHLISKQANRIDYIIKSILTMAKQKEVIRNHINLASFFNDLLEGELRYIAIHIHLDIATDIDVFFDESQLKQVVVNLIENAHRHNNWHINNKIQCKCSEKNDKAILCIIDSGDGVVDVDKLFTPFYSTSESGTGLGLYLCKMLCETNKASLEYKKLDVGSCFSIGMEKVKLIDIKA